MRPTDHDHRTPFDHEFDGESDAADVTQEFWGTSRGWEERDSGETRRVAPPRRADDTTGAIRAIRDGMAAFRPQRKDLRDSTGQVRRTREHGAGTRPVGADRSDVRADASIGDLASGRFDEPFDDLPVDAGFDSTYDDRVTDAGFDSMYDGAGAAAVDDHDLIPLTAADGGHGRLGLGAVDPLLVRFGALALVGVLLVPVALALRPSDPVSDSVLIESPVPSDVDAETQGAPPAAGAQTAGTADPADASAATAQASDSGQSGSADGGAMAAPADAAATADSSEATDSGSGVEAGSSDDEAQAESEELGDAAAGDASSSALDDAATVDEPAERVVPECPQIYTAGEGDSWFGIADAAGVSPSAVMNENRATGDTVILPGDEICLPENATVPATPAPSADPAPDTTAPTTPAPTTAAPTTTAAPASPASADEVKALIRATWPADQHETAMMIAQRESRFDPRADNNWCCYGVFQIYFTVHQSWLDDFGVYQASDLFDAEKNIAAAYHLYEQSGGWGPWGF